jgi:plastocyanin
VATDASGSSPARGLTWPSLLRISVIAIIVGGLLTEVLLVRGFEPVITVFMVLYIVGLVLRARGGRAGTILIGVATLAFIGFGAPFFILSLAEPKSTAEFAINLLMLVAGIVAAISAVALLRRSTSPDPSVAARMVGAVAAVVVVAGFVLAGVVRATLNEPEIRPGDLTLVAQDTEFSTDHLHANSGEISIVVDNKDLGGHTFAIEKLDLDESLPGGISTRLSFTAPSGTYRYFCSIPGHEETMHGTLTVH